MSKGLTEYKLYIDETGNDFPSNSKVENDARFTIVGMLIKTSVTPDMREKIYKVKKMINDDEDFWRPLHHTEIYKKVNENENLDDHFFSVLRKDEKKKKEFLESMASSIDSLECTFFCVGVNPKNHSDEYGDWAWDRYQWCLDNLLTCVGRALYFVNGVAEVFLEKRTIKGNKDSSSMLISTFEKAKKAASLWGEYYSSVNSVNANVGPQNYFSGLNIVEKLRALPGLEIVDHVAQYAEEVMLLDRGESYQKDERLDPSLLNIVTKKFRGSETDPHSRQTRGHIFLSDPSVQFRRKAKK